MQGAPPTLIAGLGLDAAPTLPPDAGPPDGPTVGDGAPLLPDRYEDLGPIAQGGMGEVRRAFDRGLQRRVAIKLIHPELVGSPAALARFLEEAQATAQLQHPHIVPVYDLGRLPDGRLWFAMKEVQGLTWTELIAELHVHAAAGAPGRGEHGLRRMVSTFHAVCRAVAYAHAKGVLHRDLKPDNIMVGAFGEVYVLDWGLARVFGSVEPGEERLRGGRTGALATQIGQVSGTPAYMPPEQARGDHHRVDARADVYALGATLYHLLAGRPPYAGPAGAALRQVLAGPPPPVDRGRAGPIPQPPELIAACARAMEREPALRFPTAAALADAVQAWLDGSARRALALEQVQSALRLAPEAAGLRRRAAACRALGDELLQGVPDWAPEAAKAPGWAEQDAAAALDQEALRVDHEVEALLQGALAQAPDLPEAHALLAERRRGALLAAERARADATLPALQLRGHADALPDGHPQKAPLFAFLQGDGALTLLTAPAGADVELRRFELRGRRLVPGPPRALGPGPLRELPLPMGSYLCVIRAPGCEEVRYPVHIGRGEHWDGAPPGGRGSAPVWLPPAGSLGPEDRYIPAGWFQTGGDPEALWSPPGRRVWLDGFVLRQHPVRVREHLAFLNHLAAAGRADDALRWAPREGGATPDEPGALRVAFDGRRFSLPPDGGPWRWGPESPVTLVDWEGARAFAAWEAARTGLPWRLPAELEWEKAARGVDGRVYPWGDWLDPSWACLRDSHPGPRALAPVDAFPVDESVYGVRGMAGNARDWCLDRYTPTGPEAPHGRARPPDPDAPPGPGPDHGRVLRGGSWDFAAMTARLANRYRCLPDHRYPYLGLRLARSLG